MTARPQVDAPGARRLFLQLQGLSDPPNRRLGKAGLRDLIQRLGFVQVDSINTVERAHQMILFSRNQTYRPADLKTLLERDRALFENWTHDASIIPVEFYPYWRRRFERERERLLERWRRWHDEAFEHILEDMLALVREEGALLSRDLEKDRPKSGGGWWDWHPSKTALEYHWRCGALAVCGREGFQKRYDLAERVIPAEHHAGEPPHDEALIDWACRGALERLGIATSGELAAFWDIVTPEEAKAWAARHLGRDLIEVELASLDGTRPRKALAAPDIEERLAAAPEAPGRLRVLSPFDPVLRDRKRAQRLFGFDYKIEVFVPAHKRRYGYYVLPLLEGERMVGRIDMKANRPADALEVSGLWWEPGVKASKGRLERLEAELDRVRRFAGVGDVTFLEGWQKE